MKKILIAGSGSYIGTSFEKYIKDNFSELYSVDTVDMMGGDWRETSFAGYDAVFHVAGIAHRRETKDNSDLYYEVNRDLAFETAKKAKADGVRQFVFLSSMSVYGLTVGAVTGDTEPRPKSNYGRSKLEAEALLNGLADDNFAVAVLRPPMVYGRGCKGNYTSLSRLAAKCPVFPLIKNKRSMLYIGNLNIFVKGVIDGGEGGLFLPQNREYVCTSDMVRMIRAAHGRSTRLTKLFNFAVYIMMKCGCEPIRKAFGDLYYSESDCDFADGYSFETSVSLTESDT